MEPLVAGLVALAPERRDAVVAELGATSLRHVLQVLVQRYDCRRVGVGFVLRLRQAGFGDLALALVRDAPHVATRIKFDLALAVGDYVGALDMLVDEQQATVGNAAPTPGTELARLFQRLGRASSQVLRSEGAMGGGG